MGVWDFLEDKDLRSFRGSCIYMTCQQFTYGVDQHCQTMVVCNLRQRRLQQDEHPTKRCNQWTPTWRQEVG